MDQDMGDRLSYRAPASLLVQVASLRSEQLSQTHAVDRDQGLDVSGSHLHPAEGPIGERVISCRSQIAATQKLHLKDKSEGGFRNKIIVASQRGIPVKNNTLWRFVTPGGQINA